MSNILITGGCGFVGRQLAKDLSLKHNVLLVDDMSNNQSFIPKYGKVRVYHKSRLVPGVEKMPFPKILDPIAELIVDLGGTSGSLGSDNKS